MPLEITALPRPHVVLVVGVNGSGKTTTIAKLAHLFTEQDYSVMLAAGDTFRAAAIAQLQTWGDRAGVPVISGKEGPAAAGRVFDAHPRARAGGSGVLSVPPARRLPKTDGQIGGHAQVQRLPGHAAPTAPIPQAQR